MHSGDPSTPRPGAPASRQRGSRTRSRRVVPPTWRAVSYNRRSRRGGWAAHAARTIADTGGVGDRGEDDAIGFADPLLVRAAAPADDARARAADQRGGRALEPQELCLHRAAKRIVAPGAVAPDDAVAGHDHRYRIGAERVADRTRRAGMPHSPRQGR